MKTLFFSLVILSAIRLTAAEETPSIPPKTFETPLAASDAFIQAATTGEEQPLLEVFGNKHQELIGTDDPARDRELRGKIAGMAKERRRFRFNGDGSVSMVIGAEAWPFPVPIVMSGDGWRFDTDAGIHEVVKRRIGENELSVIDMMGSLFHAQQAYAITPHDGSKVREFARRFESSPGKHDGLYWPVSEEEGAEPSPAGPELGGKESQFAGYQFKILTAQGESAPAGKYSYLINDHLIGGFAILAWPVDYGKTGVMSFIINHYEILHQKDLGPDTAEAAAAITEYNPDAEWTPVEE